MNQPELEKKLTELEGHLADANTSVLHAKIIVIELRAEFARTKTRELRVIR